jgi:hypothetical protein
MPRHLNAKQNLLIATFRFSPERFTVIARNAELERKLELRLNVFPVTT